eukprot:snap_masked-scaffold_55-processed-gene-0.22-mRNA-1 protein AED:1.00 eAED:1.00 QI:0/0/0/0/1/1/3/0/289
MNSEKRKRTEQEFLFCKHPENEIRTSSKSETRYFSCCIWIGVNIPENTTLTLYLTYAGEVIDLSSYFTPRKVVLKTFQNEVHFDDLFLRTASVKHKEKEFQLMAQLDNLNLVCTSNSFYAYTHNNVLKRRKNIHLELVSPGLSRINLFNGVERFHVIGQPFIKGPNLCIRLQFLDLQFEIKEVDWYSESVIFFDFPVEKIKGMGKVDGICTVSNDGRNFSNGVNFTVEIVEELFREEELFELMIMKVTKNKLGKDTKYCPPRYSDALLFYLVILCNILHRSRETIILKV